MINIYIKSNFNFFLFSILNFWRFIKSFSFIILAELLLRFKLFDLFSLNFSTSFIKLFFYFIDSAFIIILFLIISSLIVLIILSFKIIILYLSRRFCGIDILLTLYFLINLLRSSFFLDNYNILFFSIIISNE